MPASRGDSKPCSADDCTGTMRFGRRSDNDAHTPVVQGVADAGLDDKGWVCSADAAHFRKDA